MAEVTSAATDAVVIPAAELRWKVGMPWPRCLSQRPPPSSSWPQMSWPWSGSARPGGWHRGPPFLRAPGGQRPPPSSWLATVGRHRGHLGNVGHRGSSAATILCRRVEPRRRDALKRSRSTGWPSVRGPSVAAILAAELSQGAVPAAAIPVPDTGTRFPLPVPDTRCRYPVPAVGTRFPLPCPVPDAAGTRFPLSDASTRCPTPVPAVRRQYPLSDAGTRYPVPGTWNLEPDTRYRCSNLPRPTSCPDTCIAWDPSRSHAPHLRRQPSDKLEFPSYLILAYSPEIVRYSELTEILGNPHFSHSQGALCSSHPAISAPLWRHWPPNMSPRHVGHHVAPLPRVLGTWIGQGGSHHGMKCHRFRSWST